MLMCCKYTGVCHNVAECDWCEIGATCFMLQKIVYRRGLIQGEITNTRNMETRHVLSGTRLMRSEDNLNKELEGCCVQ